MLGIRSHAQQTNCIDTLKALAQGVFSGAQQQYALKVAQIDECLAITEAILAIKDPARRPTGWDEKLQGATEAMRSREASSIPPRTAASMQLKPRWGRMCWTVWTQCFTARC